MKLLLSKPLYRRFVGFVLSFQVLLAAGTADALEFALGEKDLNLFVQKAFPIKRSYLEANIYLSEPVLKLDGPDNQLSLSINVTAIQGGHLIEAVASVQGRVTYDAVDYVLELEEPALQEFTVLKNTMQEATPLLEGMRKMVGQSFPVIALIDLNQFDLGFGKIRPKVIHIEQRRLVITL